MLSVWWQLYVTYVGFFAQILENPFNVSNSDRWDRIDSAQHQQRLLTFLIYQT